MITPYASLPFSARRNGRLTPWQMESASRARRLLKWLYPGLRIKRWFFLTLGGAAIFGMGVANLMMPLASSTKLVSLITVGMGLGATLTGLVLTVRSVLDVMAPASHRDVVDAVFERRHLEKGVKIVAIGGGTGLSTLLHGLKTYTANITAIVTVADDGGSSGRLREEFGMLPPGDIRSCLVALADTEPLMQQLLQHRFSSHADLDGHNFGNLLIAAMTQMMGDFEHAVQAVSRVLAVRGHVVPSTNVPVRLVAEHGNGRTTIGESKIGVARWPIRHLHIEPAAAPPTPEALHAIRDADLIIIGPGSLYTSIIPNLLITGMVDALVESAAAKVYICNVMTQFRETNGMTASDHVRALISHTHPAIIDACVVNAAPVPRPLVAKYRREQAAPVVPDVKRIRALGYHVVTEAMISADNYVRHNPQTLAGVLIRLETELRGGPALQVNGREKLHANTNHQPERPTRGRAHGHDDAADGRG